MKRFENALRMLQGKDADISFVASENQEYIETTDHLPKARILDLFQQRCSRSITRIGTTLLQISLNNNSLPASAEAVPDASVAKHSFPKVESSPEPQAVALALPLNEQHKRTT